MLVWLLQWKIKETPLHADASFYPAFDYCNEQIELRLAISSLWILPRIPLATVSFSLFLVSMHSVQVWAKKSYLLAYFDACGAPWWIFLS